MADRLKVADFYHSLEVKCVLEVMYLEKAFFLNDKLFVTTKDAPILLHQYSLKQLIKEKIITLPHEQLQQLVMLGNLMCFFFNKNQDLWIYSEQKFICLKSHFLPITTIITYKHNLVTGSEDMTLRIWNPYNKVLIQDPILHIVVGHTAKITCFLKHQSFLLSGSADKSVVVWKGVKIWSKKTFSSSILKMTDCSQNNQLAIYEQNGNISIINSLILANQKNIQVSRIIKSQLNKPILQLNQIDDSFLQIITVNDIEIAEINLGVVMAKIPFTNYGNIVSSKCLRKMTFLAISNRGLYILYI